MLRIHGLVKVRRGAGRLFSADMAAKACVGTESLGSSLYLRRVESLDGRGGGRCTAARRRLDAILESLLTAGGHRELTY